MNNLKMNGLDVRMVKTDWLKKATYNRALNNKAVANIVKNFDEEKFGYLIVSDRDRSLYVIDGQHRLQAAKILNIPQVRCLVKKGLTEKQEAEMFLELNSSRVKLKQYDYFKARLVAGDPVAIQINQIVESCGFSLDGGTYKIQAVKTVEQVFKKYGPFALDGALTVIMTAWRHDTRAWQGFIIQSLSKLIYENPIDKDRLIKVLGELGVSNFLSGSRGFDGKLDWDKSNHFVKEQYNKGLRKNKI